MIRIPRTKRGIIAYIFAIFMLTFSIFATSNTKVPKRIANAPSPTPQQVAVLGTQSDLVVVTRIIDGDTFELSTGEKVRMIGIDTPETVDPRKPVQCYGKEASKYTSERLLNQSVKLTKDISETDTFGRLLRYVYVGEELFNKTLVSEGYAHARSFPPDIAKQDELRSAERDASFLKKGLWSGTCKTITSTSNK